MANQVEIVRQYDGGAKRNNAGKSPLWLMPNELLFWHCGSRELADLARVLFAFVRREPESDAWLHEAVTAERLLMAAHVAEFGARKYAAYDWEKGYSWTDTVSSGLRHCIAQSDTDDGPGGSGLPHLWHCAWNVAALSYFAMNHPLYERFDDRPPAPEAPEVQE